MADASSDPMLQIWEAVSQPEPDGNRVITWRDRNDLNYLYDTGLVDTDRWKKEDWIDAYKDSLQPNGSYRVTQEQWLAKRRFRYDGPTGEPFDPMSLREGEWSLGEIDDLIRNRLLPSTSLQKYQLDEILQKGKEAVKQNEGRYVITKQLKFALRQLLSNHPSPRRLRELSVKMARTRMNEQKVRSTEKAAEHSGPSGFQKGPSAEKSATDQLNKLIGKGQKQK